jgi:hypothetical protein
MGLGAASTVSLIQARELAAKWRAEVIAGRNPLEARVAERRRALATAHTFGKVARKLFEEKSHNWRNAKVRKHWMSALERYGAKLMSMPVGEIKTEDVYGVL